MARIDRLIGVYDADGSLPGEGPAYLVGHVLDGAPCALRDITHGRIRRKPAFDALTANLPVPFELLHRDELPSSLASATAGQLPCVVADRAGDLTVLVGRVFL